MKVPETASVTKQEEQARLLEEARKQPGVAEAMDVYNAASRYVPQLASLPAGTVGYATGGNQR